MDYNNDHWNKKFPSPIIVDTPGATNAFSPMVTKQDIEELRKEFIELKKLVLAAIKYDEATGQPKCETEAKTKMFKQLAEMLGIDIKDLNLDGRA